jgi:DMSO/TMAO reductase YedYZ molybdopterin-dependent catalytic subunit
LEAGKLKKLFAKQSSNTLLILAAGLLLLALALFVGLWQWAEQGRTEPVAWDLTLIGRDGQQVVLSYDELQSLPVVETRGGFFSSVGTVYGPHPVKGVRLETLLDLVGGMTASDVLLVAAKDGYSSVFDYGQLSGEIDTFEPDPLRLVPQGDVEFLLIFEQQGQPLAHNDGQPLRLAVVNPDGLLTEGHWWVKWVNRLEIRALPPATSTGG